MSHIARLSRYKLANLFLSIILGNQLFLSQRFLWVIARGDGLDGYFTMIHIVFGFLGILSGSILGFLLWILPRSQNIQLAQNRRYWLFVLTILSISYTTILDAHITPLAVRAAQRNDVIFLKTYHVFHGNLNVKDFARKTPLITASEDGNFEATDFLIGAGAELDIQDIQGSSALISSSSSLHHNSCKIATRLIHAGANVNLKNLAKRNALILATQSGNTCIVEALLKTDIDVYAKDRSRKTALYYAAYNNNIEIIKILQDAGVKFEHQLP